MQMLLLQFRGGCLLCPEVSECKDKKAVSGPVSEQAKSGRSILLLYQIGECGCQGVSQVLARAQDCGWTDIMGDLLTLVRDQTFQDGKLVPRP